MDELSGTQFEGIANTVRRKRSQTSRRPKPESQVLLENYDYSSLSSTPPSDDIAKVSSDENTGYNGSSKRKIFNLNQCISRDSFASKVEGGNSFKKMKMDQGSSMLYGGGGAEDGNDIEQGQNDVIIPSNKQLDLVGDGVVHESKFKKVKLKVGGVTRTIQTKSASQATSESGSLTKSVRISDAPRPQQKPSLQDDSDEDFPPPGNKSGLKGIPWKDFSRGGFSLKKDEPHMGRMSEKTLYIGQGEKSDLAQKNKRVQKKHDLTGVLDDDEDEEDDDEIRYLEKLRTSKVVARIKDVDKDSSIKHQSLSRVSKSGRYDSLKDIGPSRSGKDGKKFRPEIVSDDTDYEEEELLYDDEPEGKKKKTPRKDSPDPPTESKREISLTMRQRALLNVKDASSLSASSPIEFPNGLPPPPPRRQKDKLTEVEQQLKKAEAAERRRMQNEKAARESEAEAIRKILGQDSSRKKREDKLKKRQEELAQERAANARTLPPNTVRCVIGPTGTRVIFSEDMGLPCIFDTKPCSYPPPREKCAGPSCDKPYKYRDSKSRIPLCSLQCYKTIHENMQAKAALHVHLDVSTFRLNY